MLVGAGVRYGGSPMRLYAAPTGPASVERAKWGQPGNLRNFHAGEATVISGVGISHKSGYPNGYRAPGSWSLPNKAGGLSSFSYVNGSGTLTGSGAMGLNATADLTGTGDITSAVGQLVVSAVATLTGTGTITDANAVAFLNAAATLTGSGDLTGAVEALGHAVASLTGSGTLTTTVNAIGELEAEITPFTGLTPQSVAAEVWNSVASAFNNPGSMGAQANFLYVLAHHKVVTDPASGIMTIYDTDGTTVLWTAELFEDAAGSAPYDGGGAERREKFE